MKKRFMVLFTLCMLFVFAVPTHAMEFTSPKVTSMEIDPVTGLLRISWEKVEGAASYNLYMKENGQWKFLINEEVNTVPGSDAEKLAKTMNFQYGNVYIFAVTVVDENGVEGILEEETREFTISRLAPTSISSAKAKGKSIKVSWKRVSGAAYYQVSCKRAGAKAKVVNVSKTSLKISKLKKGKKYAVKVRAVKGNSYSNWSATKKVKVK